MNAKFCSIEAASVIKPGDLVRIKTGYLASNTAVVLRVERAESVFSPINGWYSGAALRLTTDLGPIHHFCLDPEQPVQEAGWVPAEELGQFASK